MLTTGIFVFGAGVFAVVSAILSSRPAARVPLGVLDLLGAAYLGVWGAWGVVSSALRIGFLRFAPALWTVTLVSDALQLLLGIVFLLEGRRLLRTGPPSKLRPLQIPLGVIAMLCGIALVVLTFTLFA